jgi:hypothetical protein
MRIKAWMGIPCAALIVMAMLSIPRANYCLATEAGCEVDWPGWLQMVGVIAALMLSVYTAHLPISHAKAEAARRQASIRRAAAEAIIASADAVEAIFTDIKAGKVATPIIPVLRTILKAYSERLAAVPRFDLETDRLRQNLELAMTAVTSFDAILDVTAHEFSDGAPSPDTIEHLEVAVRSLKDPAQSSQTIMEQIRRKSPQANGPVSAPGRPPEYPPGA